MKTAIYIEDGVLQLVITPESKFEKDAVASIGEKPFTTEIFRGAFYDCRGGWVRQEAYHDPSMHSSGSADNSIILKVKQEA